MKVYRIVSEWDLGMNMLFGSRDAALKALNDNPNLDELVEAYSHGEGLQSLFDQGLLSIHEEEVGG